MFEKRAIAALVASAGLALPMAALGQITEIPEFTGDFTEDFEDVTSTGFPPCIVPDPFDGMATLCSGGAHVTSGWSFRCVIGPHGGSRFFGSSSGPAEYTFAVPVTRFGGYFGTNALQVGEPTDAGRVEFYDEFGGLIGEGILRLDDMCGWHWLGWEIDEPVFSIIVRGSVFGGAFVDMDDMDIDVVGGFLRFTQLLGDAAPPAELCGKEVTPFPLDDRPLSEDVTTVPSPICGGGELTFSIPMNHRRIGAGWGTWSHGYTGDVYYTNGAASMDVGVPDNTSRFYLYVEPNPFSDIEFEISYSGGGGSESATDVISGSSGAKGFGFCDDKGIDTIGVRTTDGVTDFAIGEFGICTDVPAPFCYADCDESGELDFFDFLCFQNQFGTGDCRADCDGSGTLDFFDFLCFQNEFAAGCPELQLIQLGVEAPPGVICGRDMQEVVDTRPVFGDVTTVPTPIGDITFDIPCSHRRIGSGWGSWSHGYTGDVYYTNGSPILNVGAPAGNTAFYMYVEPNPFALIEFEITGSIGGASQSVIESINGSSGAAGYAFCGGVENVEVRTTDGSTDFAVGEFGVAN